MGGTTDNHLLVGLPPAPSWCTEPVPSGNQLWLACVIPVTGPGPRDMPQPAASSSSHKPDPSALSAQTLPLARSNDTRS
jgi:hypothetical protein